MPIVVLALSLALQAWQTAFPVDTNALTSEGETAYFILKPGLQATYASGSGRLVITVLDRTEDVAGVTTRVVEEREWKGDQLVEVSRNYYAIDPASGDVYYFGEDVETYKHGNVVNHEGSWRHGRNGARFGLMMPGSPAVGMKFYQEQARGVAMDRAEIISVGEQLVTPAGAFDRCVKTRETTPLEPLSREYKLYAPGIGLVQDGDFRLVSRQLTGSPAASARAAARAAGA